MIDSQPHSDFEIRFAVPRNAEAGLLKSLEGPSGAVRSHLQSVCLDTPDLRLARSGLSWQLRREARRWTQTLVNDGEGPGERFEHSVPMNGTTADPSLHAGTPAGDRMMALLREAEAHGLHPTERFRLTSRRVERRVRTRGTTVQVRFDSGHFQAGGIRTNLRELEIQLVSGRRGALLDLAARWQARFGLVLEPQSVAERGRLITGGDSPRPVRKAETLRYAPDTPPIDAYQAALDECLDQIGRNAVGLVDGEDRSRVEHVHQMRVGIRRLRSALKAFEGWVAAPPDPLVAELRSLFADLGRTRDADVLDAGVRAELIRAGAPILIPRKRQDTIDLAGLVSGPACQAMLMAWLRWRDEVSSLPAPKSAAAALKPLARRRLKRWHQHLTAQWRVFSELDETGLHDLRKRVKRMRYSVEFFAPVLRRRAASKYLRVLSDAQARMGALNDLLVAREHYQAMVAFEPAAWFALGWLAARMAQAREDARVALGRLVAESPLRD